LIEKIISIDPINYWLDSHFLYSFAGSLFVFNCLNVLQSKVKCLNLFQCSWNSDYLWMISVEVYQMFAPLLISNFTIRSHHIRKHHHFHKQSFYECLPSNNFQFIEVISYNYLEVFQLPLKNTKINNFFYLNMFDISDLVIKVFEIFWNCFMERFDTDS